MTSRKKRHNDRTILYIIIGIIVLVLFMGVFGLNALIGSSLFLSRITSSPEKQDTGSGEDFFGTLSVDDPPFATNSAKLIMSGTVTGFDTVEFYINDEKVDDSRVSKDGTFTERIGDLRTGDNEIYVKATTNRSQKTKESEQFSVAYSSEKPTLTVTEPQPDTTTNEQEIRVVGETTGSEAKINGLPVVVDAQGLFERSIRLQEGDNEIDIYVEDEAGNSEKTTFTVRYEKDE